MLRLKAIVADKDGDDEAETELLWVRLTPTLRLRAPELHTVGVGETRLETERVTDGARVKLSKGEEDKLLDTRLVSVPDVEIERLRAGDDENVKDTEPVEQAHCVLVGKEDCEAEEEKAPERPADHVEKPEADNAAVPIEVAVMLPESDAYTDAEFVEVELTLCDSTGDKVTRGDGVEDVVMDGV
jgi:hypothetical protein